MVAWPSAVRRKEAHENLPETNPFSSTAFNPSLPLGGRRGSGEEFCEIQIKSVEWGTVYVNVKLPDFDNCTMVFQENFFDFWRYTEVFRVKGA